MLLVALAVFFGACYILYLRTLQSKLVLFGEKSPANGSLGPQSRSLGTKALEPKPKSAHAYIDPSPPPNPKISDTPDAPLSLSHPHFYSPDLR